MATHRTVTQTRNTKISDQYVCDLCRQGDVAWSYQSKTPPRRHHADDHTVTDWWTETTWLVCRSCAVLVDDHDQYILAKRILNMGQHTNIKTTYRLVAGFFENLQHRTKRRMI